MKQNMNHNIKTSSAIFVNKQFLNKTSKKRTTSLQGTNGPSPKCPLFGGFTVFMSYMYLLDCDDGVLAGFDSADDSTFDSFLPILCEMEDRKSHKAQ